MVIATRQSVLALWQADHVKRALEALYPACTVRLLPLTTRGDEVLDRSLSRIGGKGLFVKELETALEDGRADIAVHSAKDVPMELPEGFSIAAFLPREDPRDAFVSIRHASPDEMPAGALVGTSSLRREAQLRERFPHLRFAPLRGNVHTRLAKLDAGVVDAAILAAAGLKRLGLQDRVRSLLDPQVMLPAPGQGALAIELHRRSDALLHPIARLQDPATAACVRAERAVSRALGGSCQVPLAAHAILAGERLRIQGLVALPDASRIARAEAFGTPSAPESLGEELARLLLERGADRILEQIAAGSP